MVKDTWGGIWTELKLDTFEKYVKAYLKIMNNNRDKYGWKLIYFDAFAGSGSKGLKKQKENELELFHFTEENGAVYRGAAERVVNIDSRGFDYYYFIESDAKAKAELEKKLESANAVKKLDLQYRLGDANKYLKELAETMKNYTMFRSLVLIDPFGMQIDWKSIEQFKGTRTDLWILVPSGVIINRLLDGTKKLKNIKKLSSFFGLPEDEIKNYFYKKNANPNLFNMEEYQKISEPIQNIVELYMQRLHTIFNMVTPMPLKMLNSRNVPIYHFAFVSNNPTALKIANDIIEREMK